jgi:acyl transferase domain-containing protein
VYFLLKKLVLLKISIINVHILGGIYLYECYVVQVVTEEHPWKGRLASVNAFGFGGANAHVLLQINEKEKVNGGAPVDPIPRLIVASGRTKEAVDVILKDVSRTVCCR